MDTVSVESSEPSSRRMRDTGEKVTRGPLLKSFDKNWFNSESVASASIHCSSVKIGPSWLIIDIVP